MRKGIVNKHDRNAVSVLIQVPMSQQVYSIITS